MHSYYSIPCAYFIHPRAVVTTSCLYILIPWTFHLFCQPPSHPATINIFSVSTRLCLFCIYFLDSTYKQNHMVFVFVWLISHGILSTGSVHVVVNGSISSFYASIPLYICTHGHVCCFHNLEITSNAARKNIGVHISFQFNVLDFLDK